MSLKIYEDIENAKCIYCGRKATTMYLRHTTFLLIWNFFCKECGKMHRRVKDDLNANYY